MIGNYKLRESQLAPAWMSSPPYRGTLDILWSCIITLTACIYTAIHLNVPPLQEGRFVPLWRKIKWVALALFAPEVVLYTASVQYNEARLLVDQMNSLIDRHDAIEKAMNTPPKPCQPYGVHDPIDGTPSRSRGLDVEKAQVRDFFS